MSKATENETSMVLYSTQYHCIEELSNENKGVLLDALFRYIIEPNERRTIQTEIADGETRMAFKFIADRIEADKKRYAETCEKNRNNAKKRWEIEKGGNAVVCGRIQPDANNADNDNDKVNDKDKENVCVCDKPTPEATTHNTQSLSKEETRQRNYDRIINALQLYPNVGRLIMPSIDALSNLLKSVGGDYKSFYVIVAQMENSPTLLERNRYFAAAFKKFRDNLK